MAVSMWGQQAIQATMPAEPPVKVGTIWVDTSGTATLKICTSVAPYTFATISGGAPAAHATSHENGGSDEISVAGLSGLLADEQNPLAHKTDHENGGADEISVAGLSGLLADAQTPIPAGSDTQIQFKDGSAMGADGGLTYNKATDFLTLVRVLNVRGTSADPIVQLTTDAVQDWCMGVDFSDSSRFKIAASSAPGSGDVFIASNTGIEVLKFAASQAASAGANDFDDYEEGTWTPVIGGSGGQSGQAYDVQVAQYTKKGREVTITFHVQLSTKGTITGNVQLQGMPFSYSNSPQLATLLTWSSLATNQLFVFGHPSGTSMTVYGLAAAATGAFGTVLVTADINNSSQFRGFLSYNV